MRGLDRCQNRVVDLLVRCVRVAGKQDITGGWLGRARMGSPHDGGHIFLLDGIAQQFRQVRRVTAKAYRQPVFINERL